MCGPVAMLLVLLVAAAQGGAATHRDPRRDPHPHRDLPTRIGDHLINADAATYAEDAAVAEAAAHFDVAADSVRFVGGDTVHDADAEALSEYTSSSSSGGRGGSSSSGTSGRRSGIQIGSNQSGSSRASGRGQSSIKIGATNTSLRANISLPNRTLATTTTSTTTTTTTEAAPSRSTPTTTPAAPGEQDEHDHDHDYGRRHSSGWASDADGKKRLRVGLVLPYKAFGTRDYTKALTQAISGVQRTSSRGRNLVGSRGFDLQGRISMMPLTPSPKVTLEQVTLEMRQREEST
ncbi:U3 small nucleolar RNA-associated protein 25 [Frankliniella fusca]|uniref:U3 small nucleolar RNA-associated protein 25 n=1 Tax=Frankliniella fusca TaxID=407009 RepID=A0AAE1GXH7_9NEOP|nr:U3 small nucleolar RNA-associated protein 25 [Frankliniella fusca]